MKRKAILVSVYYYDKEPVTSLEDWDAPDYLFLNDVISESMKRYNPDSNIFDVCIDETKPWLFAISKWWSRHLYRLIRR